MLPDTSPVPPLQDAKAEAPESSLLFPPSVLWCHVLSTPLVNE